MQKNKQTNNKNFNPMDNWGSLVHVLSTTLVDNNLITTLSRNRQVN